MSVLAVLAVAVVALCVRMIGQALRHWHGEPSVFDRIIEQQQRTALLQSVVGAVAFLGVTLMFVSARCRGERRDDRG